MENVFHRKKDEYKRKWDSETSPADHSTKYYLEAIAESTKRLEDIARSTKTTAFWVAFWSILNIVAYVVLFILFGKLLHC